MKLLFKNWICCFIFLLIISSTCEGRNSDYFLNFELANNKIYVLHADGVIKIFDDTNGKLLDNYSQKSKIIILTKDQAGSIVIADEANNIKRLDAGNQWKTIASLRDNASITGDKLLRVIFDKRNNCFLITDKGLFDLGNKKSYFPDRHLALSEWAYRGSPYWESSDNDPATYVDDKNNIWVNFDHGEWGNDLFVFNQKTHDFISIKNYGTVPYYEANGQLFSTVPSLFNFILIKYSPVYDRKNNLVQFESAQVYSVEDVLQKKKESSTGIDISEGNSTYNRIDGNFYFISSKGLRRTKVSAPIHKFSDFTLVKNFKFPKSITKAYEYYDNGKQEIKFENGYPQYVSKLEFTAKGKLVLLPSSYGVWLFDGEKLTIVE